jgi:hypothetical protein
MPGPCVNRLAVIGRLDRMTAFQKRSRWQAVLHARFGELLEMSEDRFAWSFETDAVPVEEIRKLSRRRPELVFLLDYEIAESRIKGIVKARAGEIERCDLSY